MPAPAVIPAPIVYFKVVAVKTLVVYSRFVNTHSSTLQELPLSTIKMGGFFFSFEFVMLVSVLNLLSPSRDSGAVNE